MKKLSRRDIVIMPLLAVISFAGCLAAAEIISRFLMPQQFDDRCALVVSSGFKPDCVSSMKVAEGPKVISVYNECGSRSPKSCGEPAGDEFRVAVMGTSISRGYAVDYENTYAPRAERKLGELCHRPVNFQMVDIAWPKFPDDPKTAAFVTQARKALDLHPGILLVFVSSWDLFKYNEPAAANEKENAGLAGGWKSKAPFKYIVSMVHKFRDMREQSTFVLLTRHVLYRNDAYFLQSYLSNQDESDYIRTPLSPAWDARMSMLERVLAPVGEAAANANRPLALVYAPMEAQVLLARKGKQSDNLDPYLFERSLASVAKRHHWSFIDTTPVFVAAPPRQLNYYRVNGHPNANGQRLLGDGIVAAITASDELTCRR
jgi:hypothetical protein